MKKLITILSFILWLPTLALAQYDYDGTDDAHRVDNPNIGATSGFSFCIRINPDALSFGETIVNYGNGTDSSAGRGFALIHFFSNEMRFYGLSGATALKTGSDWGTLSTGTPFNVCVTVDGSQEMRAYVDGTLVRGPESYSGGFTAPNSTDDFLIGAVTPAFTSFGHTYWNGKLAHFAYWNTTLSGSDVTDYETNCPDTIQAGSLQVFVPGTDNPATDQSSNTFGVTTLSAPTAGQGASFPSLPTCGAAADNLPILQAIGEE